jgi:hypothetical protein
MAPLLDLPTELLNEVLLKLEQESLKELRRVCRESHAHVTPILFSRVYFDFDLNGTDALVNISRHPRLATHVKTIKLQRRSGLKKFDDFWDWQHATIYDHEPLVPGDGHDEVEILEDIMSRSDWEHMTDDSRRALFHDYQLDYAAINRRTSQLASAMSSAIQHSHGCISESQNITEADRTIREFNAALERLVNITNFDHRPVYHLEEWGERWRQIQFHREALRLDLGYEGDVPTDALQLFVALQGIMFHADPVRNVTLQTRGHAFWSATYLCRLLDWNDDSIMEWNDVNYLAGGIDGWIDRIGGPVAFSKYIESATRYLARLESSFSRLESLECYVGTGGLEDSDEEPPVSEAVSRVLQCGKNLTKLRLALRQSSWDLDLHDTPLFRRPFSSDSQQFQMYLLASENLFGGLVASQALHELQTLDLTIITVERHLCALLSQLHSLRRLALRYVSLLPGGGVWESIFQLISTSLRLESAALVGLEDVVDGYPRLLLQPDASVWKSGTTTKHDYQRYESAIIDFVLRKSVSLPAICPTGFLCQLAQ